MCVSIVFCQNSSLKGPNCNDFKYIGLTLMQLKLYSLIETKAEL